MSKLKEQLAWDNFAKACVGRRIKFHRVENQLGNGTPDVIGINNRGRSFWLEVKALESWPARRTTKPLRNSFEKGQIPFLKEWCSWGGSAFVLLRVANDFYLLNARPQGAKGWPRLVVPDLVECTVDDINAHCIAYGKDSIIDHLEDI